MHLQIFFISNKLISPTRSCRKRVLFEHGDSTGPQQITLNIKNTWWVSGDFPDFVCHTSTSAIRAKPQPLSLSILSHLSLDSDENTNNGHATERTKNAITKLRISKDSWRGLQNYSKQNNITMCAKIATTQ